MRALSHLDRSSFYTPYFQTDVHEKKNCFFGMIYKEPSDCCLQTPASSLEKSLGAILLKGMQSSPFLYIILKGNIAANKIDT